MKQTGYLIARTGRKSEFFTSSSAYDRPTWVTTNEATIYKTVELAEKALTKLLRHGAYQARLVDVAEAMEFEFPNGEKVVPGQRPTRDDAPHNEYPKDEMVADEQTDVCPRCEHDPCTCETDTDHDALPDETERLGHEEEENAMSRARFARGQRVTHKGSEYIVQDDSGTGIATLVAADGSGKVIQVANTDMQPVHESSVLPAKPAADAAPSENSTTAATYKADIQKVKFHHDSRADDSVAAGGEEHHERVTVPANVLSDLKAAIADFSECAEKSNGRDDARASFCMTCAEAFKQLLADLEQGTVEGVKAAQIHMTSWMNPITSNVPTSVQKFVYMGGRKPTLKDLFADKMSAKKEQA